MSKLRLPLKSSATVKKTDDDPQYQPVKPDRIEIIQNRLALSRQAPVSRAIKNFDVQELVLLSETVRYRMERWLTADGRCCLASYLPG